MRCCTYDLCACVHSRLHSREKLRLICSRQHKMSSLLSLRLTNTVLLHVHLKFFFLSIKRGHFHNSFFFYSPVKELCLKQTLSVNRCAVEGGTGKPIFHQKYFPRKCLIIPKFTTTLNLVQRHKETANRESALLGTVPQRAAIPPWLTYSMCRMGKPTRISFGRGHIVLPSFLYPQGTSSLTIC